MGRIVFLAALLCSLPALAGAPAVEARVIACRLWTHFRWMSVAMSMMLGLGGRGRHCLHIAHARPARLAPHSLGGLQLHRAASVLVGGDRARLLQRGQDDRQVSSATRPSPDVVCRRSSGASADGIARGRGPPGSGSIAMAAGRSSSSPHAPSWRCWRTGFFGEALSALVLERTRRSHGRRLATRVQFHFLAAGAGDHHRPLYQPHTLGMLATLPEVLLTGAAEPIAIGARVPPMLPRCPVRV
jgi:hypothetical protein